MTNAYTECNAEGCHRSAASGAAMCRVAPKGQIGPWACVEHVQDERRAWHTVSADLLRDGAAAARRVAAMHKGGQQQAIHQAVAQWLDQASGRVSTGPGECGDDYWDAVSVARAYLGHAQ